MVEVMVLISKSHYDELLSIKEKYLSKDSSIEKISSEQQGKGSCPPPPVDEKPDVSQYKESDFDNLFLNKESLKKESFMSKIPENFVKRQRKRAIIIAESIYASPDFKVLSDNSFTYKGNHIAQGNVFNLIKSFLYGSMRLQIGQKEFMNFLKEENLLDLRKDILKANLKRAKTSKKTNEPKLEKMPYYPKWFCIDA